MKRGHAKHGRPVAADAGTAVAAADMVVAAKVVASEEATDEFADNHSGRVFGQGWIRTSEGVKPADLQSAPFGHFGTYPSTGTLAAASLRRSRHFRLLFEKFNDCVYHVSLRVARNLRINRQRQRLARGVLRLRKIAFFVTKMGKALLLM